MSIWLEERIFIFFLQALCSWLLAGMWVLLGCHSVPAGRGQVWGEEGMRAMGKEARMDGWMDEGMERSL